MFSLSFILIKTAAEILKEQQLSWHYSWLHYFLQIFVFLNNNIIQKSISKIRYYSKL